MSLEKKGIARRKVLAAATGVVGSAIAPKLWAQRPCAPPELAIAGGGSGVVTPCGAPDHVKAAAAGQWTAIGLNRLADVAFDYSKVAVPPGFSTGIMGIVNAWCGAVYAPDRGKLYVNGGGHNDYDGNEWYSFDVRNNVWERVNDPSLLREEDAAAGVLSDNTPIPIHSYNILAYSPDTRLLYRLGRSGSSLEHFWSFDPDTRTWTELKGSKTDDHSAGSAYWSQAKKQFAIHSESFSLFSPSTGVHTFVNPSGPTTSKHYASAFSESRQEMIWRTYLPSPDAAATWGDYSCWRLTSNTKHRLFSKNSPPLHAGHGLAWDSRRARYVAWHGGSTLYYLAGTEIDSHATGMTWTSETPTAGVTPTAAQGNGTYGRFQYLEEFDVFIAVNRPDEPVFMFKPADWALA